MYCKNMFLLYSLPMDELTPLELRVMRLLAEGLDAFSIMDWLGIDYSEYVKCKNSILKKLKIKRIAQILPTAVTLGLIDF